HGRAVDVFADQAQRLRGGESDVATDLWLHDLFGAEAEGRGVRVAGLLLEGLPADGASIQAGRRAGFESASPKPERPERLAEQHRGGFAAATGGITLLTAVDEA